MSGQEALLPGPAFGEFFRGAYQPLVRDVIFAGATPEEAEDAVAAAMAEVLERWEEIGNLRAYARRAAVNKMIKSRQRGLDRVTGRLIERGDVTPDADLDPGGDLMNTGPDGRSESLEDLFGSVYELAGEFAWQIGRDEVEARLRRVLRQAGRETGTAPAPRPPGPGAGTAPAGGDVLVTSLVSRATAGDQAAWSEIVERYAPLIYAICRGHRLSERDIEDVGQQVWMRLAEQIGRLRDPAALPGWLATTTARECLRAWRRAERTEPLAGWPEAQARFADDAAIDTEILAAERDAALRAAVAELPARCQQLLAMLIHDPPYSYQEISARLGIPVGSIGPQRARCLDRLRRTASLAALSGDRPQPRPRPAP